MLLFLPVSSRPTIQEVEREEGDILFEYYSPVNSPPVTAYLTSDGRFLYTFPVCGHRDSPHFIEGVWIEPESLPPDVYALWVVDAGGRESNHLTITYSFAA